jgi:hypothetical protein
MSDDANPPLIEEDEEVLNAAKMLAASIANTILLQMNSLLKDSGVDIVILLNALLLATTQYNMYYITRGNRYPPDSEEIKQTVESFNSYMQECAKNVYKGPAVN